MQTSTATGRRLSVGAELAGSGQVSLRVWAPDRARVAVVIDGQPASLQRDDDGWFEGTAPGVPGSRYGFRLDDDPRVYPDPASRFQPDGPHGLSEIVDPLSYSWRDSTWRGLPLKGQILYELHVGTFTPEGTWSSAASELERLRDLGVTTVLMMPVADFPGEFGWGYDGVNWLAPSRLYGRPDELRAFVDAAHALGLAVILDVVFNHFGPDGNYVGSFARGYFSKRYTNEWGESLNFDEPGAQGTRELVLASVEHWIAEYHFDGFRLDATQQIFDASRDHVLAALTRRARAAAGTRQVVVIAENEAQDARLLRASDRGGYALDALYNDDFHHTARVELTGVREAYYSDFHGTSHELLSAARRGFLFQGQRYPWQQKNRGTPALDIEPSRFVHFLENHDHVANSSAGLRLSQLANPAQLRALTALLLLGPATPLLFQGQEWGSEAPFLYFAHHEGELGRAVRNGRLDFLRQFRRIDAADVAERQLDPTQRATFEACRLRQEPNARTERFQRLHADLIALRRGDRTLALQGDHGLDGATLDDRSFVLRFFGACDAGDAAGNDDRLLVVNLGSDLELVSRAEPLVAPPSDKPWRVLWSSEAPQYGGSGTPTWREDSWPVPGNAAILLGS